VHENPHSDGKCAICIFCKFSWLVGTNYTYVKKKKIFPRPQNGNTTDRTYNDHYLIISLSFVPGFLQHTPVDLSKPTILKNTSKPAVIELTGFFFYYLIYSKKMQLRPSGSTFENSVAFPYRHTLVCSSSPCEGHSLLRAQCLQWQGSFFKTCHLHK